MCIHLSSVLDELLAMVNKKGVPGHSSTWIADLPSASGHYCSSSCIFCYSPLGILECQNSNKQRIANDRDGSTVLDQLGHRLQVNLHLGPHLTPRNSGVHQVGDATRSVCNFSRLGPPLLGDTAGFIGKALHGSCDDFRKKLLPLVSLRCLMRSNVCWQVRICPS